LDPNNILFGASDGGVDQSDSVFIGQYGGIGFGINTEQSTFAYNRIKSAGIAALLMQSSNYATIKFQGNTAADVGWQIGYDSTDNELKIEDLTDLGTLHLGAGEIHMFEGISATNALYLNSAGFQVTAAESHLSGELSLGLNANPAFDFEINTNTRAEVIATGFGTSKTIFGARYANGTYASPSAVTTGQEIGEFGFAGYKTTTFSTSATAYIKGVATENWADAATGTKLEFAVNLNGATGSSVALTIDQDRNVQLEKKIKEYNNAAPTDGQLLIGNTAGGTFDAATITAGSGITITNGGGTITVA
jgi:hypothetical protein